MQCTLCAFQADKRPVDVLVNEILMCARRDGTAASPDRQLSACPAHARKAGRHLPAAGSGCTHLLGRTAA
jgi:hypothetical protein